MSILTGGANFIKYILFLFNFLFVITGIILIGVGVTVSAAYENYAAFLQPKFFSVPTFLIVIGSLIFIIAFFGCCGAIKENYCMTITFSVLLILIFILELAAGISGYVLRNNTYDLIKHQLNGTLSEYGKTNYEDVTRLWDVVQREFECCGISDYKDWQAALNVLPVSCCPNKDGATNFTYCTFEEKKDVPILSPYAVGCLDKLTEFMKSHAVSLGGAGIALAIIQFGGIFFACYIAKQIKHKYGASTF